MNIKRFMTMAASLLIAINLALTSAYAISRTDQDATGYGWSGNKMANGEWPEIGCVAVHPTTYNGSTPVIPFGTFLYVDSFTNTETGETTEFVPSPEGELTILKVSDLGDVKKNRGLSTYWVDLYWGSYEVSFGKSKITYHY